MSKSHIVTFFYPLQTKMRIIDLVKNTLDFLLHVDTKLMMLTEHYGTFIYFILFAIIFVETWLVFVPFLPGDSLLFIAWVFASKWIFNIRIILWLMFAGAVLWDTVNYFIGRYFGQKIIWLQLRGKILIKQDFVDKTHAFFAKYGKKSIIMARFVPIIRTFAPFVAGIWNMEHKTFISYNIVWWFVRVVFITLVGYFFGNIPLVENNFEKVVLWIIFISITPIIVEIIKKKYQKNK